MKTSGRLDKRRSTLKYNNEQNSKLSPDCQLMFDDEKYFTLTGNVPENSRYYS